MRPVDGVSGTHSNSLTAPSNNADTVDSATLGSGNLREVVKLPLGEDLNEWLAVTINDLFKQVRMLFGIIKDECTQQRCPTMSAGPNHTYFWSEDKGNGPEPMDMSASLYIDCLLSAVGEQLDDEELFPSQIGRAFPVDFESICRSIMARLVRVYAHVMNAHADCITLLNATPHVNTSFKHFILFAREFKLISQEDLAPLAECIERILG